MLRRGSRFNDEELKAVVSLLAGPGAVWELMFGSGALFQPERINAHAQAVIQTTRADEHERGCLPEEQVLDGDLTYHSSMARLEAEEERFVLLAMHQTMVERGLCLREHTDDRLAPLLVGSPPRLTKSCWQVSPLSLKAHLSRSVHLVRLHPAHCYTQSNRTRLVHLRMQLLANSPLPHLPKGGGRSTGNLSPQLVCMNHMWCDLGPAAIQHTPPRQPLSRHKERGYPIVATACMKVFIIDSHADAAWLTRFEIGVRGSSPRIWTV
jgi:hypothetical protein